MGTGGAVYTAVFGRYESINPDPFGGLESDLPRICFTDDPDAISDVWEMRVVSPRFPDDPVRSARMLKIRGHESLEQYDQTLWIDNTVELRQRPEDILAEWLADADIAMPVHQYRATVLAEFDVVAREAYDEPARVYEQLIHYSDSHPDVLGERPYWTALIARRRSPVVAEAMDLWADHVLRYSRRDQLSVNAVLGSSAARLTILDIPTFDAATHRWPSYHDRKPRDPLAALAALRPPVAELGRLQNLVTELEARLELAHQETRDAQDRYTDLVARLAVTAAGAPAEEVAARVAELSEERTELLERAAALQAQLTEMRSSTSWKLTAPVRRLGKGSSAER